MKNLQNFGKIFALSLLTIFVSCESENVGTEVEPTESALTVTPSLRAKLDALALNSTVVEPYTTAYPDGSTFEGFKIGGDILLTEDEINTMSIFADQGGITSEQYRTNNLVSQPRTLSVIGYTGGQFALSSRGRTGLRRAINNYNALNLGITFTLRFARSTAADIVVFDNSVNNPNGAGGSAGFPTGGNPFQFVQIFGLDGFSSDVNEHVVTHEIGHSIGFRHTDFFSRQSCGDNINEGDGGVGAIHIPGTPTGFDPNSIMLACFNSGVNGEFNANDRIALQFLY